MRASRKYKFGTSTYDTQFPNFHSFQTIGSKWLKNQNFKPDIVRISQKMAKFLKSSPNEAKKRSKIGRKLKKTAQDRPKSKNLAQNRQKIEKKNSPELAKIQKSGPKKTKN